MKILFILLTSAIISNGGVVTKTVGVGGDFANYKEVVDYLDANSPLSGQYVFNQISDIIQNESVTIQKVGASDGTLSIEINGNYYTLFLSAQYGICLITDGFNQIVFKTHSMVIRIDTTQSTAIYYNGVTGNGTSIYNCFIYSLTSNIKSVGIIPSQYNCSDGGWYKIYNCIFYNLYYGIYNDHQGTSGPGVPFVNRRYIENCSMYNCGKLLSDGSKGYAIVFDFVQYLGVKGAYIKARNVFTLRNDGLVGYDINYVENNCTIDNCATSDSSTFVNLETLYPTQINNCIDSMVAADQLESLVFGEALFLHPKHISGTGIYNGGIVPLWATTDYDGVTYSSPFPIGAYQYYTPITAGCDTIRLTVDCVLAPEDCVVH